MPLLSACVLVACGARSGLSSRDFPADSGSELPVRDASIDAHPSVEEEQPDAFVYGDAGTEVPDTQDPRSDSCGELDIHVDTRQSCSLAVDPANAVDAEGFIAPGGADPSRVFALTRWGSGHLVAWCDGTEVDELVEAFPAFQYLGQVSAPRVGTLGHFHCNPELGPSGLPKDQIRLPVTYLGTSLPDRYANSPDTLAQEWDVIVVCESFDNPLGGWTELAAYVAEFGKGLLLSGDYLSVHEDFNQILEGTGITFEKDKLDYAPLDVHQDCVADMPHVP